MEFINIVIVSVLFYFQSLRSEAYVVLNTSKQLGRKRYTVTNPEIIIEPQSIENKSLFYATCEDVVNESAKECSVLIETYSSNGAIYKDACRFTLKPKENTTNVISNYFKITRLANNKIILSWLENYSKPLMKRSDVVGAFFKSRIVSFPGCGSSETTLDLNGFYIDQGIKIIIVTPYDDSTYDVVYPNATSVKNEWLRTTYDSDGNCIMDPKTWFEVENAEHAPRIYPIKYHSPSEGHIVIPSSTRTYRALLIKNNKVNKVSASSAELESYLWTEGSAENNFIGLCTIDSKRDYLCTQLDSDGNEVMPNFNISFGYEAYFISLYNLKQGGFLLVTRESTTTNLLYHVTKIDHHSIIYRTLELPEFKCDLSQLAITSKIFVSDKGDFCLTLVCKKLNVITTMHCFSDSELSVLF